MAGAVIYTRISTERQLKKNNTLPTQSNVCNLNATKLNTTVLRTYSEVASGDDPERKKMNQMLAYIRAHPDMVDYIIVSEPKRLSRSFELALKIVRILKECKVEFVDSSNPDLRGNEAYLYFISKALEGEQEKKRWSKSTKESIMLKKSAGELWGRIPFGLLGNKRKESKVKRMFQLALKGYNFKEISEKLFSEGYGKIAESTLRYNLRNPKNTGIMIDGQTGEITEGKFKAIIDQKLFDNVQEILRDKEKQKKAKDKTINEELLPLRNVLFCKQCEKAITGSKSYYRCNRCKINIKNDLLHFELLKFLDGFDYTMDVQEEIVLALYRFLSEMCSKIEYLIQKYQKSIVELQDGFNQKMINNLATLREKNNHNINLEKHVRECEENLKRIKILQVIPSLVAELAENSIPNTTISNLWSLSPVEEKKDLIRSLFPEKLYYNGNTFYYKIIGEYFTTVNDENKPSDGIASSKIQAFCGIIKKLYPLPENEFSVDQDLLNEIYQEVGLYMDFDK